MDLFTAMSTFVQVVRKSSFTEAAKSLNISRALVSQRIADLEARLDSRLLVRTTRSVNLTEIGKTYFESCDRLLEELATTESLISDRAQKAEGDLSVIVPKWIGSLDVADAVMDFCSQFPRIRVDLALGGMSSKPYDFLERGFDMAIQTRRMADSLIRVKRIASIGYAMVAAPAFLEQNGPVPDLQALTRLACVTQTTEPVWVVTEGTEQSRIKVNVAFSSNTYLVLRKAALKGLGICMLPHHLVEQDLREDTLRVVLPEMRIPQRPLYAMWAPGGQPPAKVRCFTSFLAEWFKANPLS